MGKAQNLRGVVIMNIALDPDIAALLTSLSARSGQTKRATFSAALRSYASMLGKVRIDPEEQGELPLEAAE